MTYTQPNTDIDLSIIPSEDIAVMAKKMQAAGQIQIARDIARLKAMGKPIHYTIGKKLIREEANGQKFELLIREDGSEQIIGEII
jgi:predicted DNA-binding transcriptional regulator YafY